MDSSLDEIKVLHLDRDEDYLEKIKRDLEESEEPLKVLSFSNTEKALSKITEENVDCALIGFNLEEMTGIEFMEKAKPEANKTPFILLDEDENRQMAKKVLFKGAEDYFIKEDKDKCGLLAQRIHNTVLKHEKPSEDLKDLDIYKKLVENSLEPMFVLSPDLEIVMANNATDKISGLSSDELEGQKIEVFTEKGILPEKELNKILKSLKSLIDSDEESVSLEIELEIENETIYAEIDYTKFYDESDELAGLTSIVHDITDIEKQRRTTEKQLEEFSSLISHDLRNPLNLAQGYLDLAIETGDKEDYEVIQKAHSRMENIIEELLIITSQEDRIKKEEFSLKNVFEEAYYFTGDETSEYKVEGNKKIYGDRAGATTMLENLISNSIEHNEEPVELRVGPTENGFYYEDTGKGIDKDERGQVFEYGYSSAEDGRGIGLSIVKRIAEVNNWHIELSDSEEGGLRFEVETE